MCCGRRRSAQTIRSLSGVKCQRAENAALFDLEGVKPLPDEAANRSRATMWDVPRFAEFHQYQAIVIENVVDAYRWIPSRHG